MTGSVDPPSGTTDPDQSARRLSGQAAVYLVGTAGAALIQFLLLPFLTRVLGTEGFGEFGLVLTATTALVSLMGLGSDMVLARFWFDVDDEQGRHRLATTWILAILAWSGMVAAVAVLLSLLVASGSTQVAALQPALVVGIIAVVPQLLATMLAQVLRNEFRAWPFAVTQLLQGGARAALALLLVTVTDVGVSGVFLGFLLADGLVAIIRWRLARLRLSARNPVATLRPLIRFGAPFVPGGLAFWAYNGLDRLMLAGSVDAATIGPYVAAGTLLAPFTIVMTALAQAWLPHITDVFTRAPDVALKQVRVGLEVALLLYGAIALTLSITAAWLLRLVAGAGFEAGAVAMPLLALGYVFWGVSMFAATGSTLARRSGLIPIISVASVLVEVVALAMLIPSCGLAGAAAAVAIGYFVMCAGFLAYSQHWEPVALPWWRLGMELAALTALLVGFTWVPDAPALRLLALLALAAAGVIIVLLLRPGSRVHDDPRDGVSVP